MCFLFQERCQLITYEYPVPLRIWHEDPRSLWTSKSNNPDSKITTPLSNCNEKSLTTFSLFFCVIVDRQNKREKWLLLKDTVAPLQQENSMWSWRGCIGPVQKAATTLCYFVLKAGCDICVYACAK